MENPVLTLKDIRATSDRKADGWRAVLEFPNGGRQLFSSRHGTKESADREAQHARRARVNYPACVIADPGPNMLQDLEFNRPAQS